METNIVEESLPVLSHGNSEISLEASYPEFYSEIINSNNSEQEKVKLLKSKNWITERLINEIYTNAPSASDITAEPGNESVTKCKKKEKKKIIIFPS